MFQLTAGWDSWQHEELSGTAQGDLVNILMIYACGTNCTNIYKKGMIWGNGKAPLKWESASMPTHENSYSSEAFPEV
jgi:hypothetical protein